MERKKWYMKLWVWFIVIVILLSIPIVINKCFLIGTKDGHINTVYTASDILNFYGAILSFIGTVLLGALALWQNMKLHEINNNLQKTQMREQVGILFPQRMPEEYKEFAKTNPYTPLKCGGVLDANDPCGYSANKLHISLENRGKDNIFDCCRLKSYVNGKEFKETTLYGHGLLIEIGESIKYNYDIAEPNDNKINTFDILTTFVMQNCFGIEYFQLLYIRVARSTTNSTTFSVKGYNSLILFSDSELENAVNVYLHRL